MRFFKRFEYKLVQRDPKDGDLFSFRAKPKEILVEDRSRSDVQTDRNVKEPK